MKPADMLHQMCHVVLAGTDVKAIRKAREFPPEAASSRGVLETLFLSKQGLANVLNLLEPSEVALLRLLKHGKSPVDVAFFAPAYGPENSRGTFHQRFQNVFAEVKQRLVRGGVLLLAEATQETWQKKSKMELWRFALPAEFHGYLPLLIQSPRQFDGDGKWRPNVVLTSSARISAVPVRAMAVTDSKSSPVSCV